MHSVRPWPRVWSASRVLHKVWPGKSRQQQPVRVIRSIKARFSSLRERKSQSSVQTLTKLKSLFFSFVFSFTQHVHCTSPKAYGFILTSLCFRSCSSVNYYSPNSGPHVNPALPGSTRRTRSTACRVFQELSRQTQELRSAYRVRRRLGLPFRP